MPLGRIGKAVAFGALGSRRVRGALAAPLKGGTRVSGRAMKGFATNRGMRGALVGGAAVAGVGAAILDPNGPWADVQQNVYGDPAAFRTGLRGAVKTGLGSGRSDVVGPASFYYGQPINATAMGQRRRSSGGTTPVPGETVFGMHNLRR